MSRQHATPLFISTDGAIVTPAVPLAFGIGGHDLREKAIRDIVHRHPECLPISEIDPLFINPVPICVELSTPAGPIDNLLITPSGLPVLVECKLWRNPEGRREVVGQILDYAKELVRWSASDLQREARKRIGKTGDVILDLIRASGHDVDEVGFNDALTYNLRRGRFLLLIVGDGIRQGVESIAEYFQNHTGLHFTLGLIELPIYSAPGDFRLVVPRVVARTHNIVRTVVAVPDGYAIDEADEDEGESGPPRPETQERREGRERRNAIRYDFWTEFLKGLQLDDPDQMPPSPARGGHVVFKFGAPNGSSWLTVYRDMRANAVGLFLSGHTASPGERAMRAIADQADAIREELGPGAIVDFSRDRPDISQQYAVHDLETPEDRAEAIQWLRERTNAFVNALRPRIRSALLELASE